MYKSLGCIKYLTKYGRSPSALATHLKQHGYGRTDTETEPDYVEAPVVKKGDAEITTDWVRDIVIKDLQDIGLLNRLAF